MTPAYPRLAFSFSRLRRAQLVKLLALSRTSQLVNLKAPAVLAVASTANYRGYCAFGSPLCSLIFSSLCFFFRSSFAVSRPRRRLRISAIGRCASTKSIRYKIDLIVSSITSLLAILMHVILDISSVRPAIYFMYLSLASCLLHIRWRWIVVPGPTKRPDRFEGDSVTTVPIDSRVLLRRILKKN